MMLSGAPSFLRRVIRSLWFTPAVYAAVALVVLIGAPLAAPLLPEKLNDTIGLDGVYDLLDVLASSLLAVSIFSLGILASSTQAATRAATPRSRPLLTQDRTAQNAISTFLGGFIFSIVGIVGLSTNFYSDASKVLLFLITCLVLLAVIVALIRWIGRLSKLGDVSEVISVAEAAARASLGNFARDPFLGGVSLSKAPTGGFPLTPKECGYVQTVDTDRLGQLATDFGTDLYLVARPGSYVDAAHPFLISGRPLDAEKCASLRSAYSIGQRRTFDMDTRLPLIVLSEIGSRALSPGVNDPGTAIDVIGALVRVLAIWATAKSEARPEIRHRRLHVLPQEVSDLLEDSFRWIARDGANQLEVQIRIQEGLQALKAHDETLFGRHALLLSQEALTRAESAMSLAEDKERLRDVANRLR